VRVGQTVQVSVAEKSQDSQLDKRASESFLWLNDTRKAARRSVGRSGGVTRFHGGCITLIVRKLASGEYELIAGERPSKVTWKDSARFYGLI
jgi:hypothetical protein